ncbi:nuclear transport factor 2 family protein [Tritonibacter scottomollicae]|uniref:nuclear transport factor 2 family protein n=1 Tax=Tritonibacter scottomollicae TaxID=483013 RepID=UPI003AA7FB9A
MSVTETVLNAFTGIFVNFDADAAANLLAPDYIQHNVAVPTGAAPILGFIPALAKSGITVTTYRVLTEGDLVVLHNTYDNAGILGAESLVAFDVFRVADGKVIEHWDNLTPVAAPNPSGHTQTDGPTEVTDRSATADNKALVTGFVETILIDGELERITDFISTETYIQHNSAIADGLDGLGAGFGAMAAQGIAMVYTDLQIVVAESNFVFTASEGTLSDAPTAFFDLFRVADGKIVEHWDVVTEIPAVLPHDNGKF